MALTRQTIKMSSRMRVSVLAAELLTSACQFNKRMTNPALGSPSDRLTFHGLPETGKRGKIAVKVGRLKKSCGSSTEGSTEEKSETRKTSSQSRMGLHGSLGREAGANGGTASKWAALFSRFTPEMRRKGARIVKPSVGQPTNVWRAEMGKPGAPSKAETREIATQTDEAASSNSAEAYSPLNAESTDQQEGGIKKELTEEQPSHQVAKRGQPRIDTPTVVRRSVNRNATSIRKEPLILGTRKISKEVQRPESCLETPSVETLLKKNEEPTPSVDSHHLHQRGNEAEPDVQESRVMETKLSTRDSHAQSVDPPIFHVAITPQFDCFSFFCETVCPLNLEANGGVEKHPAEIRTDHDLLGDSNESTLDGVRNTSNFPDLESSAEVSHPLPHEVSSPLSLSPIQARRLVRSSFPLKADRQQTSVEKPKTASIKGSRPVSVPDKKVVHPVIRLQNRGHQSNQSQTKGPALSPETTRRNPSSQTARGNGPMVLHEKTRNNNPREKNSLLSDEATWKNPGKQTKKTRKENKGSLENPNIQTGRFRNKELVRVYQTGKTFQAIRPERKERDYFYKSFLSSITEECEECEHEETG